MDIRIDTHHVELSGTGPATIAQRASRILGRFRDGIARTGLTLRRERGSRGGESNVCVLRVDLAAGGQIVVVDRSRSLKRAIVRCLRRGRSVLARELKRRRGVQRRRLATRTAPRDLALQP
ncbi:MAG: hypothetical protein RIC56_07660 [Pseudomonadales bacterium]